MHVCDASQSLNPLYFREMARLGAWKGGKVLSPVKRWVHLEMHQRMPRKLIPTRACKPARKLGPGSQPKSPILIRVLALQL